MYSNNLLHTTCIGLLVVVQLTDAQALNGFVASLNALASVPFLPQS